MTSILAEKNQRLRVHQLANLGGLVAIAELDLMDPALLLGALVNLKKQLSEWSLQQKSVLKAQGLQILRHRNTEKRAYSYHASAMEESPTLTLRTHEIKQLILKLHGKVPVLEKDLIPELLRLIR